MQPLADAATSRAESDWLVGINATRALTSFNRAAAGFKRPRPDGCERLRLAILAGREEKSARFQPRSYFEVHADFGVKAGSHRGRWFDEKFKSNGEDGRVQNDSGAARKRPQSERNAPTKRARSPRKKSATQASPLLYDLTTLQREANGRLA